MTKIGLVINTPREPTSNSSAYSSKGIEQAVDYGVTPIDPANVVKTFQIAKYTYLMNSENKITKFCHLFKQMTHDPSIVSIGLASKMDKKKLKSKFGASSKKRQKITTQTTSAKPDLPCTLESVNME